jgi:hypothetical protein
MDTQESVCLTDSDDANSSENGNNHFHGRQWNRRFVYQSSGWRNSKYISLSELSKTPVLEGGWNSKHG